MKSRTKKQTDFDRYLERQVALREGNHISMIRENPDGANTPLAIPNHPKIKKSTLRTILNQSGISREGFMSAYEE